MYKFRIKNWGLRKNWGEALAKKTLQSLESGTTTSTPLISARTDQLRRLRRYVQRRQETEGGVPILSRRGPRSLRPAAALRASAALEEPDEVFRLLKIFIATQDAAIRPPEQDELSVSPPVHFPIPAFVPSMLTTAVLHFVLKFRLAHNLIADNHHRPGFTCLSMCFEQLSAMPTGRCTTLLYVVNAALEAALDFCLPDILAHVFRFLHHLAQIRHGPRHPTTEITRRISAMSQSQYADVLSLMRQLRADCSSTDEVAFLTYDRCVDAWSTDRSSPIPGLQDALSATETQPCTIMKLWARMRLAIAWLDRGEAGPVMDMLRENYPGSVLGVELREPQRVSLILQCYKIKGDMWAQEGQPDIAAVVYRRGAVIADAAWGRGNQVSCGFVTDVERLGCA